MRLIEECFDIERLEEEEYTRYISIRTNTRFIVVDPYMINMQDLICAKPGKITMVRARRPAWEVGNLERFIFPLDWK